jgi:hypothetical protein
LSRKRIGKGPYIPWPTLEEKYGVLKSADVSHNSIFLSVTGNNVASNTFL